jgi:hypothetical protein
MSNLRRLWPLEGIPSDFLLKKTIDLRLGISVSSAANAPFGCGTGKPVLPAQRIQRIKTVAGGTLNES